MMDAIKTFIKRQPVLRALARLVLLPLRKLTFPGSKKYWENRYKRGGNSGAGSYGKLAEFKAEVINDFIKEKGISTAIEFGCGDGYQLSLFKIPRYIGLDVSRTAIKLCIERFKEDKSKSFFLYDPECFLDNLHVFKTELALSLDVIFHLVEDHIFEAYMNHLFSAAEKYVIIYSSNTDENPWYAPPHCRHRKFTDWVEKNKPEWRLIKVIKNRYPNESLSDFYIYERVKD